jgi:hypothetical protein
MVGGPLLFFPDCTSLAILEISSRRDQTRRAALFQGRRKAAPWAGRARHNSHSATRVTGGKNEEDPTHYQVHEAHYSDNSAVYFNNCG